MLTLRTGMIIGAVVAAIAALTLSHTSAYRAGRAVEQAAFLERIDKENRNAGKQAEDWRGVYRRCLADGGMFNFETGTCDR